MNKDNANSALIVICNAIEDCKSQGYSPKETAFAMLAALANIIGSTAPLETMEKTAESFASYLKEDILKSAELSVGVDRTKVDTKSFN